MLDPDQLTGLRELYPLVGSPPVLSSPPGSVRGLDGSAERVQCLIQRNGLARFDLTTPVVAP